MNRVADPRVDPPRLRIAYDGTATPVKTVLFLVVCAAWLLPGLVGHDPWKIDELQPRLEQTLGATLWSCPADDGGVFGFTAGPSAPRA